MNCSATLCGSVAIQGFESLLRAKRRVQRHIDKSISMMQLCLQTYLAVHCLRPLIKYTESAAFNKRFGLVRTLNDVHAVINYNRRPRYAICCYENVNVIPSAPAVIAGSHVTVLLNSFVFFNCLLTGSALFVDGVERRQWVSRAHHVAPTPDLLQNVIGNGAYVTCSQKSSIYIQHCYMH